MPIGNMLAAFGNRPSVLQEAEANRNAAMVNRLNQYKLDSAIREEQKQNQLGELYGRYASGDKGALDEIASVSPEWHMQIQKNMLEMDKTKREQLAAEAENTAFRALSAKDDPNLWAQEFPEIPYEMREQLLTRLSGFKSVYEAVKKSQESPYQNVSVDDLGNPYGFNTKTGTYERLPGAKQYQNPPSGMAVDVGPDGTVSFRQGPGMGRLQKPTLNKIEEKQLNATEALSRLNTINQSFKPGFATFGGRFEALFSGMKDKAGLKLSKDEATNLREFSTYRRDAISHLNRTLNELSGAAVSPAEAERLKAELPNPGTGLFDGDGPTQFKAKADASARAMKQAIIRYHYAMQSGMDPFKIDLADVDSLMDQRGSELEAQLSSQNPGMDPVTIDAMVKDQLSREFGIQ